MQVRARFIMVGFCLLMIATPAVLLTLLFSSSTQALNESVPPWISSAAEGLGVAALSERKRLSTALSVLLEDIHEAIQKEYGDLANSETKRQFISSWNRSRTDPSYFLCPNASTDTSLYFNCTARRENSTFYSLVDRAFNNVLLPFVEFGWSISILQPVQRMPLSLTRPTNRSLPETYIECSTTVAQLYRVLRIRGFGPKSGNVQCTKELINQTQKVERNSSSDEDFVDSFVLLPRLGMLSNDSNSWLNDRHSLLNFSSATHWVPFAGRTRLGTGWNIRNLPNASDRSLSVRDAFLSDFMFNSTLLQVTSGLSGISVLVHGPRLAFEFSSNTSSDTVALQKNSMDANFGVLLVSGTTIFGVCPLIVRFVYLTTGPSVMESGIGLSLLRSARSVSPSIPSGSGSMIAIFPTETIQYQKDQLEVFLTQSVGETSREQFYLSGCGYADSVFAGSPNETISDLHVCADLRGLFLTNAPLRSNIFSLVERLSQTPLQSLVGVTYTIEAADFVAGTVRETDEPCSILSWNGTSDFFFLTPTTEIRWFDDYVRMQAVHCSAMKSLQGAQSAPHVVVVLEVSSTAWIAVFSSAHDTSVFVGVAASSCGIVFALSLLHYVFRPLKILGNIMKCCAELQVHPEVVDRQSASSIQEIYALQVQAEMLLLQINSYAKYMPDKSQITSIFSSEWASKIGGSLAIQYVRDTMKAMKEERETPAEVQQSSIFGTVPHTVTVQVEYRSRRDPFRVRSEVETAKVSTFEFMYGVAGSQEDSSQQLYSRLLLQCRQRLGERIGEALQLFEKIALDNNNDAPEMEEETWQTRVAEQAASLFVEEDWRSRQGLRGMIVPPNFRPLFTDVDVLRAIEKSVDHRLNLAVMKISKKNFRSWFIIFVTVLDTLALCFNASYWLVSPSHRNLGSAAVFAAFGKLAVNTACSMYLVRLFSRASPEFQKWVSFALEETILCVLCSSFCTLNIRLLFSQTRFTSEFRFNAPLNEAFPAQILSYTVPGAILGDLLPLALITYMLATSDGGATTVVMLAFASHIVTLLILFFQSVWTRVTVWLDYFAEMEAARRREGAVGDSDALSEHGENDKPLLGSLPGDESEDDGRKEDAQSIPLRDASLPSRNLHLGISLREATILRLSLFQCERHYDIMTPVEIQAFSNHFLAVIFQEVKLSKGMVLCVWNGAEVLIGFNCHQVQHDHLVRALQCFYSISYVVEQSVLGWTDEDLEPPIVLGALVSQKDCLMGYLGSAESRSFQLLGCAAEELSVLSKVGGHYGAQLVTCSTVAKKIASEKITVEVNKTIEGKRRDPKGMNMKSSKGLMVRLIDCCVRASSFHFANELFFAQCATIGQSSSKLQLPSPSPSTVDFAPLEIYEILCEASYVDPQGSHTFCNPLHGRDIKPLEKLSTAEEIVTASTHVLSELQDEMDHFVGRSNKHYQFDETLGSSHVRRVREYLLIGHEDQLHEHFLRPSAEERQEAKLASDFPPTPQSCLQLLSLAAGTSSLSTFHGRLVQYSDFFPLDHVSSCISCWALNDIAPRIYQFGSVDWYVEEWKERKSAQRGGKDDATQLPRNTGRADSVSLLLGGGALPAAVNQEAHHPVLLTISGSKKFSVFFTES